MADWNRLKNTALYEGLLCLLSRQWLGSAFEITVFHERRQPLIINWAVCSPKKKTRRRLYQCNSGTMVRFICWRPLTASIFKLPVVLSRMLYISVVLWTGFPFILTTMSPGCRPPLKDHITQSSLVWWARADSYPGHKVDMSHCSLLAKCFEELTRHCEAFMCYDEQVLARQWLWDMRSGTVSPFKPNGWHIRGKNRQDIVSVIGQICINNTIEVCR